MNGCIIPLNRLAENHLGQIGTKRPARAANSRTLSDPGRPAPGRLRKRASPSGKSARAVGENRTSIHGITQRRERPPAQPLPPDRQNPPCPQQPPISHGKSSHAAFACQSRMPCAAKSPRPGRCPTAIPAITQWRERPPAQPLPLHSRLYPRNQSTISSSIASAATYILMQAMTLSMYSTSSMPCAPPWPSGRNTFALSSPGMPGP